MKKKQKCIKLLRKNSNLSKNTVNSNKNLCLLQTLKCDKVTYYMLNVIIVRTNSNNTPVVDESLLIYHYIILIEIETNKLRHSLRL